MKFAMTDYTEYQAFITKFAPLAGDFHYGNFNCGVLGTNPGAIVLCTLSSQPSTYGTDHPLSIAINSVSEIS